MKHTIILCASLLSLSIITSCKHQEEKQPEALQDNQVIIKDSANLSTVMNLDYMITNIPKPNVVSKELAKEGIPVNKSLLNSPDKASNYSTTFQQAVNMGIYGADLGYLTSYNQMQDVMQYFTQVAKLANGLGLTSVFDQKLAGMIGNAVNNNKDTLNTLIETAFQRSQEELYSNKRATVGTLVFAGGWIEGLYIATSLVNSEKNAKNEKLYSEIWNNVFAIRYLEQALSDYQKTNADCANMLKMLQPVSNIANNLDSQGFNLQDIQNLKSIVTGIRSKLI